MPHQELSVTSSQLISHRFFLRAGCSRSLKLRKFVIVGNSGVVVILIYKVSSTFLSYMFVLAILQILAGPQGQAAILIFTNILITIF